MKLIFMDETQDLVTQTQVFSGEVDDMEMEIERGSCKISEFGMEMVKMETKSDLGSVKEINLRAEIDTSAPFESVKEAVSRFGGIGYWKPACNKLLEHEQHEIEEIDIAKLEEQASQLENDLILKQKETLDILQELESTRTIVEELKVKLQKEACDVNGMIPVAKMDDRNTNPAAEQDDEEDGENNPKSRGLNLVEGLMQAQRNLTRTTNGIAGIRASIEVFNKKLERERLSLAKTRERLTQNSLKMSSIEEQLNQTEQELQVEKGADILQDGSEILKELQILNSEAEKFKQMGEAAKSEIMRTISKIKRKKAKIRTAEIRLVAAAKMKEAARVAEAVALADIEVLSNHDIHTGESKSRQLDKGNKAKMEILKQVKKATKEIKSTKLALEEALNSIEAAKREKVGVEEAKQKWSWEQDKKESCPIAFGVVHESTPVLKPTLSIGQILSRKLFLQEELMKEKSSMKRKVSLAQMLGKQNLDMLPHCRKAAERGSDQKTQCSRKRKKSGFARFSLFLAKQTNQKRKKPTPNLK